MENTMLKLNPRARTVEQDGQTGLTLDGVTCMAGDRVQTAILRLLAAGAQPLETLKALICQTGPQPGGDAFAALALADFILRFGDYLL